jgi:hypothetical protein
MSNSEHRGRRARDRIVLGDSLGPKALASRAELQNLLLFVDDDLRETALAIGGIESFLLQALALLEREDISRDELAALAGDADVLERIDSLAETLISLRRRLGRIADTLQ